MTTPAQAAATPLAARQQALVSISAYTAAGSQPRLREALAQGLKAAAPKYERGKQNLEKLTGKPETLPAKLS